MKLEPVAQQTIDATLTVVGEAIRTAYDNGAVNCYMYAEPEWVKLVIVDMDADAWKKKHPEREIVTLPPDAARLKPFYVAFYWYKEFAPLDLVSVAEDIASAL